MIDLNLNFSLRKIASFITIMNNIIIIRNMMQKMEPRIAKTRFTGGNKYYEARSLVLTIPIEYARAYDMEKPTNVLVTATEQGILISKLEIKQ